MHTIALRNCCVECVTFGKCIDMISLCFFLLSNWNFKAHIWCLNNRKIGSIQYYQYDWKFFFCHRIVACDENISNRVDAFAEIFTPQTHTHTLERHFVKFTFKEYHYFKVTLRYKQKNMYCVGYIICFYFEKCNNKNVSLWICEFFFSFLFSCSFGEWLEPFG